MSDVGKRIKQMVEFIKQEAKEKAEELATKSEAEFQREKMNLVEKEKIAIRKEYERKMGELATKRKIELSREINTARLTLLRERDGNLATIHEETYKSLSQIQGSSGYKDFMKKLIVQGMILIYEEEVLVRCTKRDYNLVNGIMKAAISEYKSMWKKETGNSRDNVRVELDKSRFIPDTKVGGVILYARGGQIVFDNSLQERLEICEKKLLPVLRGKLFGVKAKMGMTGEYH